jgi:hypothetical protein
MTRHMGHLPVSCRPWATVHACELGGRPWKERERAAPLVLLVVAGSSIPAWSHATAQIRSRMGSLSEEVGGDGRNQRCRHPAARESSPSRSASDAGERGGAAGPVVLHGPLEPPLAAGARVEEEAPHGEVEEMRRRAGRTRGGGARGEEARRSERSGGGDARRGGEGGRAGTVPAVLCQGRVMGQAGGPWAVPWVVPPAHEPFVHL